MIRKVYVKVLHMYFILFVLLLINIYYYRKNYTNDIKLMDKDFKIMH